MNARPRVGVSACLLGEAVRYDGGHKRHTWVTEVLARQVELVPFCPEVAAGLGVPRPPIQLVRRGAGIHAVGVDDDSLDLTWHLIVHALAFRSNHPGLCGYVFKARSPSCGLGSTPLYADGADTGQRINGLFAHALVRALPGLPAVEETALDDPARRKAFLEQVFERFRTGIRNG